MDVPADQSTGAVAQRTRAGTFRRARRRRPTGAPPPLPYHLALLVFVGNAIVESVTSNEAGQTPLNIRNLSCSDPEPLWLEARSVPSASLVPCLRSLPNGWTLAGVNVNDGRSVLILDHDRAGNGAAVVRLSASCDPTGATRVPPAQPEARRCMLIERLAPQFAATSFDVSPGGCVATRLRAPAAHRAQFTSDAPSLLGFTTRQMLRQTLEVRSDGRLQLDPR